MPPKAISAAKLLTQFFRDVKPFTVLAPMSETELSAQRLLRVRMDMTVKAWGSGRANRPGFGPLPPYTKELEEKLTPADRANAERAEYSGVEEAADYYHSSHR